MAMVSKEVDQFQIKASCRSVLPQLKQVLNERLNDTNLKKFKQSTFGPLMDAPDLHFQGALYTQLLFCQDQTPPSDKLVFHLQGQEAAMGPLEFALVTGLSFGTYPSTRPDNRFYEKVFGSRHGLTFDDISKNFLRFSKLEDEGETTLRLAMLYVLYGVLLSQSHSKKVDEKYIYMVDDLDSFDKYPWGRVAFEFLILRTHMGMKELLWRHADRKTEKLEVHGFVHALQVWAYEAFPFVADVCATSDELHISPRLLRWKTCKLPPTSQGLRRSCFPQMAPGDQGIRLSGLMPTYSEIKTPAYLSVFMWMEELSKNGGAGPSKRAKEVVRKGKRKAAASSEDAGNEKLDRLLQEVADLRKLVMWMVEKHGYAGDVSADPSASPSANQSANQSASQSASQSANQSASQSAGSSASQSANPSANPSPDPRGSPSPDPRGSPSPDPRGSPSPDPRGSPSPDPLGSPSPDPRGGPSPDHPAAATTPATPAAEKKKKKADITCTRRVGLREKKKGAAVKEPYTDPDRHKKKKDKPVV